MLRLAAYILTFTLLSACGSYRPLYGPTEGGQTVSSSLAAVTVAEQRTRTGQLVRNEIISGSENEAEKFELRLVITESTGQVSATPSTVVLRKRFNLSVQYDLVDLAKGASVVSGRSFANVSFDTLREPIADLQAAETARSRAASQVGQDVKQRLAAYFASHKVN
jgi:LPS-assembly lipoprotein